MKVGIVLTFLDPERFGGAETYSRMLVDSLQELDQPGEFVLFVPQNTDIQIRHRSFRVVACNINASHRYRRILWEQYALPGILKKENLDLVHFPYGTVSLGYIRPSVVTLHDTLRFFYPEEQPIAELYFKKFMEDHIRRSGKHVIAVSQFDGDVIKNKIGIQPENITSIYHGIGEDLLKLNPRDDIEPVVLWIGRPYPRKNVDVLLNACQLLSQNSSNPPRFRFFGIEGQQSRRLEALAKSLHVEPLVELNPPVMHHQINELFDESTIFAYPSRYESFGIPVLEALASGTPSVCADIPAFAEIHGDKVLYASPNDPVQFAEQIQKLLDDDSLYRKMSRNGQEHARDFSWKRCAEATYGLYSRLSGATDINRHA